MNTELIDAMVRVLEAHGTSKEQLIQYLQSSQTEDSFCGYTEGERFRVVKSALFYDIGEFVTVGYDECGDFGMLGKEKMVYGSGCIWREGRQYPNFNSAVFERIKE